MRSSIEREVAMLGARATESPNRVLPIACRGAWRRPSLRPHQAAAFCAWNAAGRRGVVALPSPSERTRVALAALASAGVPALVLVPTRVLLRRWRGEIARFYGGPVGQLGDGQPRVEPITVATFQGAHRAQANLSSRFQMVVVDEAHHFGAPSVVGAQQASVAPLRLGLTATPPWPGGPARKWLETRIGPVVLELSSGDLPVRQQRGCALATLSVDLTADERVAYARDAAVFNEVHGRWRRAWPGASWPALITAAAKSQAGREALAAWRRAQRLLSSCERKAEAVGYLLAVHRQAKVLVFTAGSAAAYELARRYLVMPLTGDIGCRERNEALERFRRGELRALVSARVPGDGRDLSGADVAVITGAGRGARECVERAGRLLRAAEGGGGLVYVLRARGTADVTHVQGGRPVDASTQAHSL